MAWFEELTPYSYLHADPDALTLNVGWLARGRPYAIGEVPPAFVTRLAALVEHAATEITRGVHHCDLCSASDDEGPHGNGEIRAVATDGTRFAAPVMIHHYVAVHRYRPPQAFVDAVLRTDVTQEEAYSRDLCMSCGSATSRRARHDTRGGSGEPALLLELHCYACGVDYTRLLPVDD